MNPATLYAMGEYLSGHAAKLTERLAKRPATDSPLLARIAQIEGWASECYAEANARELMLRDSTPPPATETGFQRGARRFHAYEKARARP